MKYRILIVEDNILLSSQQKKWFEKSGYEAETTIDEPGLSRNIFFFVFARNTTNFFNDRLTLDLGAQYIMQDNTNMVSQGQYYNPLPALYLFPRGDNFDEIRLYERYNSNYGYMEQYWPYGDGGLALQNPYWVQNKILRTSEKKRYMLNASLKWKIADWIDITGRVNLDNSDYREKKEMYASTLKTFCGVNGGIEDAMIQERSVYADVLANVDKSFGDFRLTANVGASIYHTSMHQMLIAGDLIIPNFFQINNVNFSSNKKISRAVEDAVNRNSEIIDENARIVDDKEN